MGETQAKIIIIIIMKPINFCVEFNLYLNISGGIDISSDICNFLFNEHCRHSNCLFALQFASYLVVQLIFNITILLQRQCYTCNSITINTLITKNKEKVWQYKNNCFNPKITIQWQIFICL